MSSRFGVVGNCNKNVKDCYIMPLRATQPVPEGLLPMSGQGLPLTRPDLLLSIIVRTKRSQASDLTSIKSDPRKSYSLATSGRFGVPPQPPVSGGSDHDQISFYSNWNNWLEVFRGGNEASRTIMVQFSKNLQAFKIFFTTKISLP